MRKIFSFWFAVFAFLFVDSAFAGKGPGVPPPDLGYYRRLTLKLRSSGEFVVASALGDARFTYQFAFGSPIYPAVKINDFPATTNPSGPFVRYFWDRIFLKEGSTLTVNGHALPLTCVFVEGQDNRYARNFGPGFDPLFLKVTLVANDKACVGPLDPQWPADGKNRETWETFLHYRVEDLDAMLPDDVVLRYHWNEQAAEFVK